mgnify:CR=1 FL=1
MRLHYNVCVLIYGKEEGVVTSNVKKIDTF